MEVFETKLKKEDIIKILKEEMGSFDPKDYVVVYKASLVLRGLIDECNDIDIEISKSIADEFDSTIPFTIAPSGDYRYQLGERLEAFYSGGERHVKKTEYVEGFQCVELNECIETYRKRNRPKDIITIQMVEESLKMRNKMITTKLIKNNDNSVIEEAILLNVNVDGLDYFVGYDGSSINVYIKLDGNYKLMYTPYSSVCYAAEPYGNIIDSPIHNMHIFSLSMNSVFKAIRWIGYHTHNSVEYEIPVDTLTRFLEVSIYYYFKRDEFVNMETFDKINYVVSKDYAVLDYGGSITYTKANEEDK